ELLGPYAGAPVPAGTKFLRPFSVTFPAPVDFQLDPYSATSQTDTSGWVPFVLPWDDAPLDLSWLNEKPAGGHGFLTVADGRLEFGDGTPAKLWGVCVSAGANFPTHEQSEKIAERMAKFGINMVRTHHADAGWSDPNFFDESYGDTQHFDAVALDSFDYFIYCLKQHGIYTYLDQLVHRKFADGDGVANAAELPYAAKPYTLFDPTLIALQKQFSHDLWTHVNPYTGLAYKDDPAVALMEFTNENDIVTCDVTMEPYATQFEQMWQSWAIANAVDPNQPVRYVTERSSDVLRFIDEVQRQYYAEMYAYLRSIGVQVPIAGNTWLVYGANLPSQATMGFMDSHAYWDHPYDNYSRWHNRPQVKADPGGEGNNFASLAVSRVHEMPFVCSEWGHPWPNEWRAEGPIPSAAVAALQGWDGVLAYTYRHNTFTPVDYLTGAFDTFNDPTVFGLMPAAALMFRRGDVAQSGPPTAVQWQDADVFGVPQLALWSGVAAYRSLVEATAVVTALSAPTGVKAVVGPADYQATAGPTWTESDTGELKRDWSVGVGTVDTPRSQAAYGFLADAGAVELSDVSISALNPFAVVAVTSLDGKDIAVSDRLLVTAVGRAENTGMVYNLTHTKRHDAGGGPILTDPITGQVTIDNSNVSFMIYAVGPDGSRTPLGGQLPSPDGLVLDL
ncbi:MAG: glycoside hydrolase 5 family protein, partial [Planctomycetota bacterium]